jgi:hypothetical protein
MIRIDLVDNTNKLKHIEFHVVPVANEKDFTCLPDEILPLRSIVRLSCELKAGRVSGHIGKYVWYRLTVVPNAKHKSPIGNHASAY